MIKKLLVLTVVIIFSLCACQKNVSKIQNQSPDVVNPVKPNEFYEKITKSTNRPIAVMIDNDDKSSLPHSGISDAYVVYEMLVEGGATRLMALFKDATTEKIGPVRSSRHYFLDYALENDAIYVHFGYSPKAANDIKALNVNNINGVIGGDGNIFWREYKFKGDWHSAYTSIKNIKNYSDNIKKYRNTSSVMPFNYNLEDKPLNSEIIAENIILPYSGFYKVSYKYNKESMKYERYMNDLPHKTQNNTQITAKNIIIQFVKNYPLEKGEKRQQLETVGSGTGYFITLGKSVQINWKKDSRQEKTKYFVNNQEISLNPNTTYINLVPIDCKVLLQ